MDKFTYLGSCISANGSIAEEISARIARAQAAFSKLRHLWRHRDISLITKGRVYNATVRPTLLYGCETWALRSGDVYRLPVFDHRCLRSIGYFSWKQRLSNKDVRHRIFSVQKQSRRLEHSTCYSHAMVGACFPYGKLQASQEIPIIRTGNRLEMITQWPGYDVASRDERGHQKVGRSRYVSPTWLETKGLRT